MSPSPAASLPIPDRLRGLTAAQKTGQDLLGSPGERPGSGSGGTVAGRTAPQRTCGLWSPILPGGHRKPSLFLSPTETLRLPRSLPTPSWTPPRLKFSGSSTRKDRGSRPGRSAGSTGCPLPPGMPLPLQLASPAFRPRSGRRPAGFREKRKHIARLRRRVYVDHGVTEGRAD